MCRSVDWYIDIYAWIDILWFMGDWYITIYASINVLLVCVAWYIDIYACTEVMRCMHGLIYMNMWAWIYMYVFNPPHDAWVRCNAKLTFSAKFNRFRIQCFPPPIAVAMPRLKSPVFPTILLIAGARIVKFIPFLIYWYVRLNYCEVSNRQFELDIRKTKQNKAN